MPGNRWLEEGYFNSSQRYMMCPINSKAATKRAWILRARPEKKGPTERVSGFSAQLTLLGPTDNQAHLKQSLFGIPFGLKTGSDMKC